MIKLGGQLYTLRKFTQDLPGIENVFKFCQEEGFETVQISGFGQVPFPDLLALIKKYQIDVCCTHSPWERLVNDLPALIEEHKQMNCPVIGIGIMPKEAQSDIHELFLFVKEANRIAAEIKKAGLQFAYHHHNIEFQLLEGRRVMDYLLQNTDPETFHFIPDTYWLQMGGVNPADFIRYHLAGRVDVCHFKDFAVNGFTPIFAEVGEGNLNLFDCFKACQEIGVSSIVIEQDICPRDPFDCLHYSFNNLNRLAIACGDRE
ncbi:MAG: sugar phosphate isomerase/epimerase [Firmicutes bacterium]|nr:sugar phosphate isomerase/epimerase [Bacillota bacterium]